MFELLQHVDGQAANSGVRSSRLTRATKAAESEADSTAERVSGLAQNHVGPVRVGPAVADPRALLGEGAGLDPGVSTGLTVAFGHDFSRVRVHTDPQANATAEALGAAAFTVGDDVVFGRGEYTPSEAAGRNLLVHELAHVVQQHYSGPALALRPKAVLVAATPLPRVDIQFQEGMNRWLVTIGGIPAAEVEVPSRNADVEIQANIDPSGAEVIVRHRGNASLSAPANPGATLGMSVRLSEIDLRDSSGGTHRAPSVQRTEDRDDGRNVAIASSELPPGNVPWLRPRGELESAPEIGPLTDWEENELRTGNTRVLGVLVDPQDPQLVIGYRIFATAGLTRIADREGEIQFESEIGLETPLLDPLDLIPTPGTAGKVAAGVGGKVLAKSLGAKAASTGVKLPLATVARLRRIAIAIARRGARKAGEEAPAIVRKITQGGLEHSFDRHAAQWFGRTVSKATHFGVWRELIERISLSKQAFRWSVGDASTIAHLGQHEGKYFVVQFFEETGELATAFVPSQSQLVRMLKAARSVP